MAPLENGEQGLQVLLLLPSPPTDTSISTIRAAYGPAIHRLLTQVQSKAKNTSACGLDIAILSESLENNGFELPRRTKYSLLQNVIAGIYRLIVHICAEEKIDLDRGDSIDPRVILLGRASDDDQTDSVDQSIFAFQGPVVTLRTLARSSKAWSKVYFMESEGGEGLFKQFSAMRRSAAKARKIISFEEIRVPGGTSIKLPQRDNQISDKTMRHYAVAVGGTFDHLHLGHRLLLTATALVLDPPATKDRTERSLTIGITGDELLVNKKYASVLESWEDRQQATYQFLKNIMSFDKDETISTKRYSGTGPNENAVHYCFEDGLTIKCVEIQDPFGPTITDETITALVLSGETRSGGKAVNERRADKGWAPLEVFEVDVLDGSTDQDIDASSDFQSKLSSSEIRRRLQEKMTSNL